MLYFSVVLYCNEWFFELFFRGISLERIFVVKGSFFRWENKIGECDSGYVYFLGIKLFFEYNFIYYLLSIIFCIKNFLDINLFKFYKI